MSAPVQQWYNGFAARVTNKKLHHGVILMRLSDERPAGKIQILKRLITHHGSILPDNFVVVTEEGIRIAKRD
jgi:hypothetical protein